MLVTQNQHAKEVLQRRNVSLTDRQLKTVECADDGRGNREPIATAYQKSFVEFEETLQGILRTLPMQQGSKHDSARDSVILPKGLEVGGRGPSRKGRIAPHQGSRGIKDFGRRRY